MKLRQQLIQDKTEAVSMQLKIDADTAFLRLAQSIITSKSVHSFDPLDLVDGGQDKQIDSITIDNTGNEGADVYIIQSKNGESFSSNALIQMANGLKWIFQATSAELDTLTNQAFKDKISELRSVWRELGTSNLRVHVKFIANGSTAEISQEFNQELEKLRTEYDNDTFEQFDIEAVGYDELTDMTKELERQTKRIDADLKIKYDTNNPSLIKHHTKDLKGVICSVPASEIARIVNDNPDGSLFDLNIRRFLGTRGGVNKDIQTTASDVDLSHEFWFLNNGITIVCDQFDPVTDPDDARIKLKNMQIVNGCQTATTIALAQRQGQLKANVRILTRIYETNDPDLVGRIVLTTNNQNQINSRDLRANEPAQIDMEDGFMIHGYLYERKPRQYDNQQIDINKLFTNEAVGQSYLAVVLKSPSDARARKYKVWGELHSKIFSGSKVEPYLIAALLSKKVADWLRSSEHISSSDEKERMIAKRGTYFVARIASYIWRKGDEWDKLSDIELQKQLADLEESNGKMLAIFEDAFQRLMTVLKSEGGASDLDRALKSSSLDRDIDKSLYATPKAKKLK